MSSQLLSIWLSRYLTDLLRYLIAAGGAFLFFWIWGRDRFRPRLIQGAYATSKRMLHDVRWSMCTVFLFSLMGTAVWYGGQSGWLRRYDEIDDYGWPWLILSVLVLIVLQDAYFYFTHRVMHHPRLFRLVHRTHHVSTNPSPWTAYAFSPIEALVHALFVPLAWFLLPLHEVAVFIFLVFMVTRNVLGHLSIELFPSGFTRHVVGRWLTTTTHHGLHHQYPNKNFGLYFTLWDRILGTTDPRYERKFEEIAGQLPSSARAASTPGASVTPGPG